MTYRLCAVVALAFTTTLPAAAPPPIDRLEGRGMGNAIPLLSAANDMDVLGAFDVIKPLEVPAMFRSWTWDVEEFDPDEQPHHPIVFFAWNPVLGDPVNCAYGKLFKVPRKKLHLGEQPLAWTPAKAAAAEVYPHGPDVFLASVSQAVIVFPEAKAEFRQVGTLRSDPGVGTPLPPRSGGIPLPPLDE